jgi:DNA helicase-2/ATP-dependent DNA helicase PcrA
MDITTPEETDNQAYLSKLNPAQRAAVEYGITDGNDNGPLLVIAGAGTGKTNTLAHRVAHLIINGANPQRILLLTFTRRAAQEMTRRAQQIIAAAQRSSKRPQKTRLSWSGTFHAISNRLLRQYGKAIGLDSGFTIMDRGDSADTMNFIRNELGFAKTDKRFPKKATCLAIYSHVVNAQIPLEQALKKQFPWCVEWHDELKHLFKDYTISKQQNQTLDYDDLLLYWNHMVQEPALAKMIDKQFDHVLVDEYQDTNLLQASILFAIKPHGKGLMVVGDDAQSIYGFRAATVRNILDFPQHFDPPARIVPLEENYRSTQPILDACNSVISKAEHQYTKMLHSTRQSEQKPILATVEDETSQVDYVIQSILSKREDGANLQDQAVLFRAAHHSDALEVELSRMNIPFHKFGGLKFLESAHVKDFLSVLRWAENPKDQISAFRISQLLPGIGPGTARKLITYFAENHHQFEALALFKPPAAARECWPKFCHLLKALHDADPDWPGQIIGLRDWYQPHLEHNYDSANVRASDLEQLEVIAGNYPTRQRFIAELTLDPPSASGDESGKAMLDEDFLILSTIHSAKGQEWDSVYILNAADGCIPSDLSTGTPEEIEEERRLLYVAMTRAKDDLHVIHPHRFFVRTQHRFGDRHIYTPRTRFIDEEQLSLFERKSYGEDRWDTTQIDIPSVKENIAKKIQSMWD